MSRKYIFSIFYVALKHNVSVYMTPPHTVLSPYSTGGIFKVFDKMTQFWLFLILLAFFWGGFLNSTAFS